MAVVVQEFVGAPVSGVAFGRDPRAPGEDRQIIEAVPGSCEGLVSGMVDPDRWILAWSSGALVAWTPGDRDQPEPGPLLAPDDLDALHRTLRGVESLLECPPDVEWTGHAPELTLLQARPITRAPAPNANDERSWYLTLRPGADELADLCERVTRDLIPALADAGESFAAEDLAAMSDAALADAIVARHEAHEHWKTIYKEQFIPFAHGVRRFGQYYNDVLQPADPYAFVALLEHQPMIATARNAALARLADIVRRQPALASWLAQPDIMERAGSRHGWDALGATLSGTPGGDVFRLEFDRFLDQYMNLTYDDESLDERPDLVLDIVRQLADADAPPPPASTADTARIREERFLEAVGPDRRDMAREVLRVARLSWQLRDDDNVLMGRLRNQLQHALTQAAQRLRGAGRLAPDPAVGSGDVDALVAGLRNPAGGPVTLPPRAPAPAEAARPLPGATPRQLIGQPASGGLATGRVRVVRKAEDFRAFRRGEVMVCDAIQPTMTHLVPLACAIVERRGGMLIHGAIIARELGVPCVNGVADATLLLGNGDLVTVDGNLGIVTVGEPEFELEQADGRPD
jgi:pyruvate,water dikinase